MAYRIDLFLISLGLLIFGLSSQSIGQEKPTYSAVILDNTSREPIPYATIFRLNQQKGTISDLNGAFTLSDLKVGDTIMISFIGYEKKYLEIDQLGEDQIILLKRKAQLLGEVSIIGDNTFLYHLLSSCRKNRTSETRTAKTYYVLESFMGDEQVELVESYYNGEFSGYDIGQLNLKNGRLALAGFDDRLFISTESSRAMYMHRLFGNNEFFPSSPFQFSKRKLMQHYDLTLNSKYLSSDSTPVYVVECVPKKNASTYFTSTVWIDSLKNQIVKVKLHAEDVSMHPFLPHGHATSISKVDMQITKSFQSIQSSAFVNSIDFNYQVTYKTDSGNTYSVSTNAVMYAFDYRTPFLLPQFEFTEGSGVDYRMINAVPYNAFFWNNMSAFGMEHLRRENEDFINIKAYVTNESLTKLSTPLLRNGFFEHPYVFWSEKRITFKENLTEPEDFKEYAGAIPADRYHLEAQLYLDINAFNDSLHFVSKTVFDPFQTFYLFPLDKEGVAFINMYFDMVEIERRKLETHLKSAKSKQEMLALHAQAKTKLEEQSKRFFKEVERGRNERGMIKWNTLIYNNLGIDNIQLFGLYSN